MSLSSSAFSSSDGREASIESLLRLKYVWTQRNWLGWWLLLLPILYTYFLALNTLCFLLSQLLQGFLSLRSVLIT